MFKTVVLVHGGFVDGSGWQGVYNILKKDGFDVVVVQNPTISLADDVAVTRRAIATAKGDVVLVGHSYGGVVVSGAGNDPKVTALVYITAVAPDRRIGFVADCQPSPRGTSASNPAAGRRLSVPRSG